MLKKNYLFIFFIIFSFPTIAQLDDSFINYSTDIVPANVDSNAIKFSLSITKEDLRKQLYIIASDSMEGRETGEYGQKKAAQYIKNYFSNELKIPQNNSLKEGYFQEFPLNIQYPIGGSIEVNNKAYEYKKDFYYLKLNNELNFTSSDIIFLGFGIDDEMYSDYKNKDVKNKVGVIYGGVPNVIEEKGKTVNWTANWRLKLEEAKKHELSALLIIDENIQQSLISNAHSIDAPYVKLLNDTLTDNFLPVFYISPEIANELLRNECKYTSEEIKKKINKKGKSISVSVHKKITLNIQRDEKIISSENVLGFIEGSDKKDEIIILTAHYDHLGKHGNDIYYGADDDGSGTVALLEIAEAFMLAKKQGIGPRRSILIMPVSGEEKGLLGSKYYSDNPVYPLKNTVVDLNIDMIGRMDDEHKNDPNYIYVIGADKISTELHQINENSNKLYTNIVLDYKYNDENDPNRFYYRSDHWNFAKNNIPVIFYFNGIHEDYHQTTDTVDKIHFEKMEKITRLVFHTAWEVANKNERIKIDK